MGRVSLDYWQVLAPARSKIDRICPCLAEYCWSNLCLPFITHLADISSFIAKEPDAQLVYASIIFNCLSSLIVLPFAVRFGRFVAWMHGKSRCTQPLFIVVFVSEYGILGCIN